MQAFGIENIQRAAALLAGKVVTTPCYRRPSLMR